MFLEPNWPFEVARQKKNSLVALIGMLNCIGAALTPPIVVGGARDHRPEWRRQGYFCAHLGC